MSMNCRGNGTERNGERTERGREAWRGIQVRDSRIKDGRDFGNAGLYAANNQCILVCSLGLHGRLHRDKCNAANLLTSFTYRVSAKLMVVARAPEWRCFLPRGNRRRPLINLLRSRLHVPSTLTIEFIPEFLNGHHCGVSMKFPQPSIIWNRLARSTLQHRSQVSLPVTPWDNFLSFSIYG